MSDPLPPRPPLPAAAQPTPAPAWPPLPPRQPATAPAGSPVPPAGSPTVARRPAYGGPLSSPARTNTVGRVALVAGILAFALSTIVVSIAAFQIGLGAGRELASRELTADFDWSILSPVRDWVLLGESAFWAGTILGLWTLVQGIVALVTDRGRRAGIAAVVLAIAAPIAFAIALNVFLTMGLSAGSGIGG
ncbi:hypothetical protein ABZ477_00165 [Microbacterium sp. NPDC019599]|uniref:hypothetical protein n=1 Tax=Microbacterium sp. NPDC019599 TaxID=3154690 RepID=UPI0033DEB444